MPIGAAKVTRKKFSRLRVAQIRGSGNGEGGGGPTSHDGSMLAGHAKKSEPVAAPATAYIVKQKARNT